MRIKHLALGPWRNGRFAGSGRPAGGALAGLALLTLFPVPAPGQDLPPVELQETDRFGMGARSLGMGGATLALSGDLSVLDLNPAGLTGFLAPELSGGLVHDDRERTVTHINALTTDRTDTRVDHLALALPVDTERGHLVLGFAYHRYADLYDDIRKAGFLIDAAPGSPGLFERETYSRSGTIDAWTAGFGYAFSPGISAGATFRYLHGKSSEYSLLANYRATVSGSDVLLDVGDPGNPDNRLFELEESREADVDGLTGSVGFQARWESGWRLGGVLDLPVRLDYDGIHESRLEDWEKIDTVSPRYFTDRITLPLSLSGGTGWTGHGLTLGGSLRWTDYSQIDYAGKILGPPDPVTFQQEAAYRSVVAVQLGGEYRISGSPLTVRAGFFTDPVPYRRIAADPDFEFVPDDNNDSTTDDVSVVYRDYPKADITSDRRYVTVGAGVEIETLRLDAAFVHGSWERATPGQYENGTANFATRTTTEETTENRILLGATVRFR